MNVELVLAPVSKFPAPSHEIGAKWTPRENGRERGGDPFSCEKHSANCAKTLFLRSILPRGLNSPFMARNFRCCSISKKTTNCETRATRATVFLWRRNLLHQSSSTKKNKAVDVFVIVGREMTGKIRISFPIIMPSRRGDFKVGRVIWNDQSIQYEGHSKVLHLCCLVEVVRVGVDVFS